MPGRKARKINKHKKTYKERIDKTAKKEWGNRNQQTIKNRENERKNKGVKEREKKEQGKKKTSPAEEGSIVLQCY